MARGTQLTALIDDLRAEVGHSLQASLGKATREVLRTVLQRVQRRLWEDYSWPFLKVRREISMAEGQRYYDLPDDITFERIELAEFKWGNRWDRVPYGIGSLEYNQWDSDQDVRSWPIHKYDSYENNQIEVWPIPSDNANATTGSGKLRFHAIKDLSSFIADADTADLDDQLLVLYAAGEILSRQKQPDSQAKLAQANAHYQRLKARSAKTDTFILGGGEPPYIYVPKGPPVIARTNSS